MFVLPSATSLRFVLLAVIVMLAAWFGGTLVQWSVWPSKEIGVRTAALAGVCGISAVLVVALALYATHPWRIRRRDRLIALAETRDHALEKRLGALIRELRPEPRIAIGAGFAGHDAQAFGFPWKPYLRLDGGLRVTLRKAPTVFDAVVLHEIAHLTSQDLLYAYGARALFQALLAVAAALAAWHATEFVFATWELWQAHLGSWSDVWLMIRMNGPILMIQTGSFGLMLLLAATEYARLLRMREHYADWGVARRGAGDAWAQLLERSRDRLRTRVLAFHPSVKSRVRVMRDPGWLYEARLADGFMAGAALGLLIVGCFNLATDFGVSSSGDVTQWQTQIILGIAFAALLTILVVVVLTMVRAALAATIGRTGMGKWLASALAWAMAFGIGNALGWAAWPGAMLELVSTGRPLDAAALVGRLRDLGDGVLSWPPLAIGFVVAWVLMRSLARRWRRAERPSLWLVVIGITVAFAVVQTIGGLGLYSAADNPIVQQITAAWLGGAPLSLGLAAIAFWILVALLTCWLGILVATRRGRPRGTARSGLPPWLLANHEVSTSQPLEASRPAAPIETLEKSPVNG